MTSLWRHSRLIYYALGPNFLTQGVELLPGEVWQVSKRNSQYFRSYLRKTTGGRGLRVFEGIWHITPTIVLRSNRTHCRQNRMYASTYIPVALPVLAGCQPSAELPFLETLEIDELNARVLNLMRYQACIIIHHWPRPHNRIPAVSAPQRPQYFGIQFRYIWQLFRGGTIPFTRAPLGAISSPPPSRFLAISSKPLQIAPPSLPYALS